MTWYKKALCLFTGKIFQTSLWGVTEAWVDWGILFVSLPISLLFWVEQGTVDKLWTWTPGTSVPQSMIPGQNLFKSLTFRSQAKATTIKHKAPFAQHIPNQSCGNGSQQNMLLHLRKPCNPNQDTSSRWYRSDAVLYTSHVKDSRSKLNWVIAKLSFALLPLWESKGKTSHTETQDWKEPCGSLSPILCSHKQPQPLS